MVFRRFVSILVANLLFSKKATVKERASAALASLQRNAYAMNQLRTRLESRVNFIMNESGETETCQELARVLELVKNGELMLGELSERIESARFLEEFIMIIDNAACSVSEIKDDVGQLVPVAEAALEELQDAILKISGGVFPQELSQEVRPILGEALAAAETEKQAASKTEEPEGVTA